MRSNFVIVMRMRKRFMMQGFGPHYAFSPEKVTSGRSQVCRHQRQSQSQKDSQEFPSVELVPVGCFKQDGGRDVQQNADEESVQCAERQRILREGFREQDAQERHQGKHGAPRPTAHP